MSVNEIHVWGGDAIDEPKGTFIDAAPTLAEQSWAAGPVALVAECEMPRPRQSAPTRTPVAQDDLARAMVEHINAAAATFPGRAVIAWEDMGPLGQELYAGAAERLLGQFIVLKGGSR